MIDLTLTPTADPVSVYRYRDGLYAADLLTAALVWLDFFTWMSPKPRDKETVCRELGLQERPTDVMLTLFTAMGHLEKAGDMYRLSQMAREHLVSDSPWFLGPYYASVKERPVCKDMLSVLRTGKTANWASYKEAQDWHKAMEREDFAASFTAAMDCRGVYLGQAVAKVLDCAGRSRLLDIGGGSGIYACSIVAHHPHLAATVFEKPPVDQVARRAIAARGFEKSVSVLAGDMFQAALPGGHDVHLISNVLHDWDAPMVRAILAKSWQALPPGGLLVIHDAHINEDKTGPLPVAAYSAMLMHSTEGKCYSISEIDGFLRELGFVGMRFVPTAADRSIVTAVKPS